MDATVIQEVENVLKQFVGLPFLFARPSYGEELTLHFGNEQPMKHPKLRHLMEGTHIVTTRLSGWAWSDGNNHTIAMMTPGETISADDLRERCSHFAVARGALVSKAITQVLRAEGGAPTLTLGLFLSVDQRQEVCPEPKWLFSIEPMLRHDADDDEVADWEVFTPEGALLVGPGLKIVRE